MNRLTIIQRIVAAIKGKSYLEIGVDSGYVLFNINAPFKYGVDPHFKFKTQHEMMGKEIVLGANLYRMTSNAFFRKYAKLDLTDGIDVAFIDGLHTYEQSLRDVQNCLKYLNNEGIIILHDCNPLSMATAYPVKKSIDELNELIKDGEIPGWNYCWNGDVWKTLIHLRIKRKDLEIFTLDLDWGLGIIRKGKCIPLKGLTIKQIKDADYSFLNKHRSRLLNLKKPKYISEFLNEY